MFYRMNMNMYKLYLYVDRIKFFVIIEYVEVINIF